MQTDRKFRYITLFILSFCGGKALSQTLPSTIENYVYTKTYLSDPTLPTPKVAETVQYLDGLGRPKQTIAVKASPQGKDVVQYFEYDALGRQVKTFLPIPQNGTQNGAVYTSPLSNASTHYGAEKIYSEKIIENSPLQRVKQSYGTGNDWNGKPVTFAYETNTDSDAVKKYIVTTTWIENRTSDVITPSGNHPANTLTKNTVTDEDGNTTVEFTNTLGQIILTRKYNGSQNVDTYYIYNEFGQQVLIVPPLASLSQTLSPSTLDALCYQYRYDAWGKLVEKKLPGKGWEYFVYDQQDRLIMTQDTNMKNGAIIWVSNLWLFTKYDKFGRIAYTGITTGGDRNSVQQAVYANTSNTQNNENRSTNFLTYSNTELYYTNTAYPTNIIHILSVNYYDTYPPESPTLPSHILEQAVMAQNSNITTKNLPTASYIKNIENDEWTRNYIWYDTQGRVIGTHSINHLGGYTKTEILLDFTGVPQKTNTYHSREGAEEVQIKQRFVYNARNMLLKHYHQVDDNPEELLAQNSYDEKGQLINKKVGNDLQSIDYAYNIRGWMTGINPEATASMDNKLFGYDIRYQNPTNAEVSPKRYNGNISEVSWKTASNGILKRYAYQYDALNRLTKGIFLNPDNAEPENKWNNETVNYDINGNITRLKRNARSLYSGTAEVIDDLNYEYSGNRLNRVIDESGNPTGYEGGGNPIEYDANGNMKTMPDKQIHNIGYNYLNLPNAFRIEENKKQMIYLYRADGTKLRKTFNFLKKDGSVYTTITDYLDGFQYLSTAGNKPNELDPIEYAYEQESFIKYTAPDNPAPKLSFFPTAEGFYDYEKKEYIYQYKDHLGNARVSYKKGDSGIEITDQNDYYPFGMNIPREEKAVFGTNSLYNFKYNGKELQETGFYDYGWRNYMSDIGRWFGMDQLSEAYSSFSPYAYVGNNPVMRTDPDGRKWAGNDMQALETEYRTWRNSGGGGGFASYFAGGGSGFSAEMNSYFGTGNATMNFYQAMSAPSFASNTIKWWSGSVTQTHYRIGDEIHTDADFGILHSLTYSSENMDWIKLIGSYNYDSEMHKTSQTLRTWSGYAFSANKFVFQPAAERAVLYGAGEAYSTTNLVFEKALPKILGSRKIYVPIMEVSVKNAQRLAVGTRVAGAALGIAGIALAGNDIKNNGVTTSNSLDLVMSVLAVSPTGWGQAIAGTYFLANGITTLVTGKDIGQHIEGAVNQYYNDGVRAEEQRKFNAAMGY